MKREGVWVLAFLIIGFLGGAPGRCLTGGVQKAWVTNYEAGDEVADMAVDSSGNIYVLGTTNDTGDFVIVKYNSSGVEQWATSYNNAAGEDQPSALKVDGAGNVYVTGSSDGGKSHFDFLTIKYSPSGKLVWSKRLNNSENDLDYANDIAVDKAGNVYVTGGSRFDATDFDVVTVKYSPSGKYQWGKRLTGPGTIHPWMDDFGSFIETDTKGNIYVTGWSEYSYEDIITIKYNSSGKRLWDVRYVGPQIGDDRPAGLAVSPEGDVYVAGKSSNESGSNIDIILIKYSAAGKELWVQRYSSPGQNYDEAQDMFLDKSGNVYITGSARVGKDKFVTLKYSPSGERKWVAFYETYYGASAYSIAGDASGNVYVTGHGQTKSVSYELITLKYDAQGKRKWAAIYSSPKKFDWGRSVALDPWGAVIVAGESHGIGWVTIKYIE